jgi:hypothetical protein
MPDDPQPKPPPEPKRPDPGRIETRSRPPPDRKDYATALADQESRQA